MYIYYHSNSNIITELTSEKITHLNVTKLMIETIDMTLYECANKNVLFYFLMNILYFLMNITVDALMSLFKVGCPIQKTSILNINGNKVLSNLKIIQFRTKNRLYVNTRNN